MDDSTTRLPASSQLPVAEQTPAWLRNILAPMLEVERNRKFFHRRVSTWLRRKVLSNSGKSFDGLSGNSAQSDTPKIAIKRSGQLPASLKKPMNKYDFLGDFQRVTSNFGLTIAWN
jgi:hypothetical protein